MTHRLFLIPGFALLFSLLFSLPVSASGVTERSAGSGPSALLVGTYHGIQGQFQSIQAAVNAAQPGDWILIGPGDYHEQGAPQAGVLVTTPNLHIRGMNRNGVILDGTRASSAPCSSDPAQQNFGTSGRNGIEVYKTPGVSLENFTVCNFLSDNLQNNGNEVWFNEGDGSGQTVRGSFYGAYLTASSTYYKDNNSAQALYGIFASNSGGPGVFDHTYASNMGDSAYYVGACGDCNTTIDHSHAQNSALGFSGSNAGGNLIIENSEWDQNTTGIAPNSLNNEDWPSPQDGSCPNNGIGPTGSHSCTIIRDNYVHDNNNANAPNFGILVLPGVGIDVAGGQNDTITNNLVTHNGLWGITLFDVPDTSVPPPNDPVPCRGGIQEQGFCYFTAFGNKVQNNLLYNNGSFGNITNGDLADGHVFHDPGNCWHGNLDPQGLTSAPANIESTLGTCGVANQGDPDVEAEVICVATGDPTTCASLPPLNFPKPTTPSLLPIPHEPGMSDPCVNVPANPWCQQNDQQSASALPITQNNAAVIRERENMLA